MTLALDISTTSIGIAIMNNDKITYSQLNADKIKKQYKKENLTDFNLYMIIAKELLKEFEGLEFKSIVIEEPLFNSANRSTVNKLLTLNTIISTLLSDKYKLNIIHQNVNKVRSWVLKKKETDKDLDKKTRTINVLNDVYGYNLTFKENDSADAIMHLLYFNDTK